MKHRAQKRTSKPSNANFDLHLLTSVYDSIGLSKLDAFKQLSAYEISVIKQALRRADKLRTAAWDPGAAYMSGVIDSIASMHENSEAKFKKITHKKRRS